MGIKTVSVVTCDRCKRENDVRKPGWLAVLVAERQVLFCPACANAFAKFLRGAAAKSITP